MNCKKYELTATDRESSHLRKPLRCLPVRKRKYLLVLLFFGLSVLLLVAAGIVYWSIYHEGVSATKSAQDMLAQYNSIIAQETTSSSTGVSAVQPDEGYTRPEAPDVEPRQALISLPGYDVIGKLKIEKIGVELPVISTTTAKALKVSICYFCGAMPGEKGNTVITGHNYANGAHFGKLDQLKTGDRVEFCTPDGKIYSYTVYETQVIKPDETEALEAYRGESVLTLLTCTSHGNRRLLVRCG